ncbi:DUF4430 domain-containing protein [Clostridium sp. MT-14]|uniref:DUF4430 domain-containing protein n=1 Tax=Clostridium sp. MT-14 TaxID=3348360 RepID=UPI0035F2210D
MFKLFALLSVNILFLVNSYIKRCKLGEFPGTLLYLFLKIKLASIGIILAVIISIMGTNASSVLAEDNNKSINIHIAVVGMYNEVIFKPQQITVNYEGEKSTAQDGLNAAGLDSTVNDQGMITSINNEENGTDDGYYGSQSGWMYKVNFMVPSDFPKNQVISDGDYLLFVYAKDHYDLLPSYDSYQNDFVNVTVKGIQKGNSFSQPVN